jgi:hypothetical protein
MSMGRQALTARLSAQSNRLLNLCANFVINKMGTALFVWPYRLDRIVSLLWKL